MATPCVQTTQIMATPCNNQSTIINLFSIPPGHGLVQPKCTAFNPAQSSSASSHSIKWFPCCVDEQCQHSPHIRIFYFNSIMATLLLSVNFRSRPEQVVTVAQKYIQWSRLCITSSIWHLPESIETSVNSTPQSIGLPKRLRMRL